MAIPSPDNRLESTARTVKAKDIYFLVVIARAYVEANYRRILAGLNRSRSSHFSSVFIEFPLFCDPVNPEDFKVTGYENSCQPDLCPYPTIVAQVLYEQTDGMHTCVVCLVPRGAPWRYWKDEFMPITYTFYGELRIVASRYTRSTCSYASQIRRQTGLASTEDV